MYNMFCLEYKQQLFVSVLNVNWMVKKMRRRELAVFNGLVPYHKGVRGSQGREVRKWILQKNI